MFVLHFDETMSKLTARQFIDEVLVGGLGARHLVVGDNFVFGFNRAGSTAMLEAESRAGRFGITVVPPVLDAEGRVCSSTNIRSDLAAGNPESAARLLGRCWEVEGRVREGDKRGRTIGFPTANIGLGDYVHPAYGVYAVWAGIDKGGATEWHPGVANVGKRPTFKGEVTANVETYIFDISADLYGDLLRVAFVRHLRPEQKFSGIEEIRTQIARDCRAARDVFDAIGGDPLLGPPDLAPRQHAPAGR
jgi:riboflavin kinase/FMN adenylyltransferase